MCYNENEKRDMLQHTSLMQSRLRRWPILLQKITVLSQSRRLFFIVIFNSFLVSKDQYFTISNEVHGPLCLSPRSFLLLIV